jgi:hypothetical protein
MKYGFVYPGGEAMNAALAAQAAEAAGWDGFFVWEPVWGVGLWPRPKSMRQVALYDGLLPAIKNADGSHGEITPSAVRDMKGFLEEHRSAEDPIDIVIEGGHTTGAHRQAAADKSAALQEAGATWWLESMWDVSVTKWDSEPQKRILERLEQGPPGRI